MGLVCASVYILLLILFIPFAFSPISLNGSQAQYTVREGIVINEFPHYQVRCPFTLMFMKLMGLLAFCLLVFASFAPHCDYARLLR
jgi:UDP-N-acetylglucosamine--dolichyl-phosphate N-acetylglucosaminephosphotransferase